MKQVKVYKLSNGDLEENKERAEERQKEIDIRTKLLDMRLMFVIEVEEVFQISHNFDSAASVELPSIKDEIKADFEKIGYYLNATGIMNRDEYSSIITYAAYKNK